MAIVDSIKKLCTPAYIYLVISMIALVFMFIQNMGNTVTYCLGDFECDVPSTMVVFIVKILYIAFWTFILNCVCRAGYKNVSWLLVLLPFILFFVLIGLMILKQGVQ